MRRASHAFSPGGMNEKLSEKIVNCSFHAHLGLQHTSLDIPFSTFWRMHFQFWIGIFLIKTQFTALHFYLGYQKRPWFCPPVSENACVNGMLHWALNNILFSTFFRCLRNVNIIQSMSRIRLTKWDEYFWVTFEASFIHVATGAVSKIGLSLKPYHLFQR